MNSEEIIDALAKVIVQAALGDKEPWDSLHPNTREIGRKQALAAIELLAAGMSSYCANREGNALIDNAVAPSSSRPDYVPLPFWQAPTPERHEHHDHWLRRVVRDMEGHVNQCMVLARRR